MEPDDIKLAAGSARKYLDNQVFDRANPRMRNGQSYCEFQNRNFERKKDYSSSRSEMG